MISTSELNDSALAISTICCLATVRSDDFRARVELQLQHVEQLARLVVDGRFVQQERQARRGSRPMKIFCATVRCGIRLSSWWIMLMPSSARLGGCGF